MFLLLIKTQAQLSLTCSVGMLASQQRSRVFFVRGFGCALFVFGGNIMSFSENFKAARKKSGLSQQQLADELKLDRSAIAHYEKGTAMPNAKNIYKICKILNVPFDELFSDDI